MRRSTSSSILGLNRPSNSYNSPVRSGRLLQFSPAATNPVPRPYRSPELLPVRNLSKQTTTRLRLREHHSPTLGASRASQTPPMSNTGSTVQIPKLDLSMMGMGSLFPRLGDTTNHVTEVPVAKEEASTQSYSSVNKPAVTFNGTLMNRVTSSEILRQRTPSKTDSKLSWKPSVLPRADCIRRKAIQTVPQSPSKSTAFQSLQAKRNSGHMHDTGNIETLTYAQQKIQTIRSRLQGCL